MRTKTSQLNDQSEIVVLDFEGSNIPARKGETIAAALIAANILEFRTTHSGKLRGLFCGMGACYDCLIEIDGLPNQRACMTVIQRNISVRRQTFFASYADDLTTSLDLDFHKRSESPDILVVGGGAGGLTAAAVSAEAGAKVMLIDERSLPGGQFFKQPLSFIKDRVKDDAQYRGGRRLIQRAVDSGVKFFYGTVWGIFPPLKVSAVIGGASTVFHPKKLIVATGAYEKSFPVPGWTLPGVMTTGAAQTLLRSYGVLPGERILIAGNGPLNFQVATELVRAGAQVTAVVESSSKPSFTSSIPLLMMASSMPHILWQGFCYQRELKKNGIQTVYSQILQRIQKTDSGLTAMLAPTNAENDSKEMIFSVDSVLLGYGFNPVNELLRLIGTRHRYDPKWACLITERDNNCQTSHASVFAVGDCCGLQGSKIAEAEGIIAAKAAIQEIGLRAYSTFWQRIAPARLSKVLHRRFQAGLWALFGPPSRQFAPSTPDTIICRCEEISKEQIDSLLRSGHTDIGEIKRLTRLGMGRCQGRYCEHFVVQSLDQTTGTTPDEETFFAPRTPIRPIALKEIATGHQPIH